MKKLLSMIFFMAAIILLAGISSYGQNPLEVGRAQLNMGVGFSGYGIPIYLGFDYGAGRVITVGGELSYRKYSDDYNGFGYNHSIFGVAGNANYHFNTVLDMSSDWDFYAGLTLGFYSWTSSSDYPGNHSSGLGLGAQVGGRYNFSQTVAINLELGGGFVSSGGKFGLTFKL